MPLKTTGITFIFLTTALLTNPSIYSILPSCLNATVRFIISGLTPGPLSVIN